jgi:MFS family permease
VRLSSKLASFAADRNDLAWQRAAITAFFAMDGFVFASWAVRIPAVKAAVGASPAALGVALLGVSSGAIATMTLSGALCRRFGSARVASVGGAWLSFALLLPALARSAVALGLSLFVFGIGYGALNVAMNSLAVDAVAALRRPVMPSFHAAWSIGGLAGAALGGLVAPAGSPLDHFTLVCALGLAVTVVCGRIVLGRPLPAADQRTAEAVIEDGGAFEEGGAFGENIAFEGRAAFGENKGFEQNCRPRENTGIEEFSSITKNIGITENSVITENTGESIGKAKKKVRNDNVFHRPAAGRTPGVWRTVLLLGVIALCATYGEGAISDWGALHLRTDLGAGAGLAAAGYAAFALAEAGGRLAGSALLARLGQTRVLVYGSLITCAGMLAAALAPVLPLALIGFALTGLGVANAFPAAMARVGLLAGPNGVAVASTLGYAGFLLGPPAIGFLTGAVTLRAALTTVSLLALVAAALARRPGL